MLNSHIIKPIEDRFRQTRGRKSQLSVRALFAGLLTAADNGMPYGPAYMAGVLSAPIDPQIASEVGLQPGGVPATPLSAVTVGRMLQRLETTLRDGWTANGQRYDLQWFTAAMLATSLPEDASEQVRAAAIDATDFPAWAKPDGADPDARLRYRSASGRAASGVFVGYDVHLAVACDDLKRGHRSSERTRPYILGISVQPGGSNPAAAGAEAAIAARTTAPDITTVIADSASANRTDSEAAYQRSAAARHQTENAITSLKARRGLEARACRKPGLTAHRMAALLRAVAHNRRIGRDTA